MNNQLIFQLLTGHINEEQMRQHYETLIGVFIDNHLVPLINTQQQKKCFYSYLYQTDKPRIVFDVLNGTYTVKYKQIIQIDGFLDQIDINNQSYREAAHSLEYIYGCKDNLVAAEPITQQRAKGTTKSTVPAKWYFQTDQDDRIKVAQHLIHLLFTVQRLKSTRIVTIAKPDEGAQLLPGVAKLHPVWNKWDNVPPELKIKDFKAARGIKHNDPIYEMIMLGSMVSQMMSLAGLDQSKIAQMVTVVKPIPEIRTFEPAYPLRFIQTIYEQMYGFSESLLRTQSFSDLERVIGKEKYRIVTDRLKFIRDQHRIRSSYDDKLKLLTGNERDELLRELVTKQTSINKEKPLFESQYGPIYAQYILCPDTQKELMCPHQLLLQLEPDSTDFRHFQVVEKHNRNEIYNVCRVCGQLLELRSFLQETDVQTDVMVKKHTQLTNLLKYVIRYALKTSQPLSFWELRKDILDGVYSTIKTELLPLKQDSDYAIKKLVVLSKYVCAYFMKLKSKYIEFYPKKMFEQIQQFVSYDEFILSATSLQKQISVTYFIKDVEQDQQIIDSIINKPQLIKSFSITKFLAQHPFPAKFYLDLRKYYYEERPQHPIGVIFKELVESGIYQRETSKSAQKFCTLARMACRNKMRFGIANMFIRPLNFSSQLNHIQNQYLTSIRATIQSFVRKYCPVSLMQSAGGLHKLKAGKCSLCQLNLTESQLNTTQFEQKYPYLVSLAFRQQYPIMPKITTAPPKYGNLKYDEILLRSIAIEQGIKLIQITNLLNFHFLDSARVINEDWPLERVIDKQLQVQKALSVRKVAQPINSTAGLNSESKNKYLAFIGKYPINWKQYATRMHILQSYFVQFEPQLRDQMQLLVNDQSIQNPFIKCQELIFLFFTAAASSSGCLAANSSRSEKINVMQLFSQDNTPISARFNFIITSQDLSLSEDIQDDNEQKDDKADVSDEEPEDDADPYEHIESNDEDYGPEEHEPDE